MTDARRRALERGADDGDLGARVAVLVDRVRRGALSDERLRCAAFLGDRAAMIVAGERRLTVRAAPAEFRPWLLTIELLGTNVTVRAGDVLTRLLHPFWVRSPLGGDPAGALKAIEDMLACPCALHAEAAERECEATTRMIARPNWNDVEGEGGMPQRASIDAVAALALAAARCTRWTLRAAARLLPEPDGLANVARGLNGSFTEVPSACLADVRDHLTRRLLPWALGSSEVILDEEAATRRARLFDVLDDELEDRGRSGGRPAHDLEHVLIEALPVTPGAHEARALFLPTFNEPCCLAVATWSDGRGQVTLLGFERAASEAPLSERPTWVITHPLSAGSATTFAKLIAELEPTTLGDADDPSGRDGITILGEVLSPTEPPHRFAAWSPLHTVGSERHATFCRALLDVARGAFGDDRSRRVIDDVARYLVL